MSEENSHLHNLKSSHHLQQPARSIRNRSKGCFWPPWRSRIPTSAGLSWTRPAPTKNSGGGSKRCCAPMPTPAASWKRPPPGETVRRAVLEAPCRRTRCRSTSSAPATSPAALGRWGRIRLSTSSAAAGWGSCSALDTKLNRIVAVKVLAPELAANPNARRRFLREAQAAAAVSHPHVVTIHAVDEDKLPYLVMECVVGQSLQEKLDRAGALRLTEILRIGRQVAEGLAAAHQQGLIHRDIKPANILLENGVERVKITDFGLARAADDVAITRAGEVSGTPQYMSPEQARGEHVDQRSDLFSLGCVLYAMCTGRPPFRGDSLAAVIKRVTEDTPRPIAEVNPEIPAWLATWSSGCWRRTRTSGSRRQPRWPRCWRGTWPACNSPPDRCRLPARSRHGRRGDCRCWWPAWPCMGRWRRSDAWEKWAVCGRRLCRSSRFSFLRPRWVAIWRGKRDGRWPWCDLSYTEPAVAAVAFLVGIQLGISMTGSDRCLLGYTNVRHRGASW